ncbi:MAG: sulfatase-like hydrolase/transferase [Candidatus Aminicenantes bacterium]|nr:MAG: sulfatase-like hydrolase/transferase [Candidatus Aminicenantes bacterium]
MNSSERGDSRTRKLIPVENRTVLGEEKRTIAEELRKDGYITAHVGKWHLREDPKTQGFDVNVGGTVYGHPVSYFSPYRNKYLEGGPAGEYLTDRLTDEAIRFVEAQKYNPFFFHLSYYAVHSPIQAKKDMVAKYENRQTSNRQNNP